ncbi:hypothetical protein BASA60_011028 [Batrachochytrium salamandrivorans]|nr:hypothetical protein BASA60_011028 [Batrachochytrium salamandrivorans]
MQSTVANTTAVVRSLGTSISHQNGVALATAFSLLTQIPADALLHAVSVHNGVDGLFQDLDAPYADFFSIYTRFITEPNIQRPLRLDDVLKYFTKHIYTAAWHRPLFEAICSFVVGQSLLLDDNLKKRGKSPVQCGLVQTALNDFIRDCLRRVQAGSESGLLLAANAVFRMSFESGELHVCTTVISQIEMQAGRVFNYTDFPKSDQVTYYYQIGKLKLRYHDFIMADHYLSHAAQLCTVQNFSAKRAILSYQIVARIVRGCLPSNQLLHKYNLSNQFSELVFHIRTGNHRAYMQALDRNSGWFMQRCTYMIMKERVKLLMYRNLFHSCFRIVQQAYPDKFNIHISIFTKAVEISGLSGDSVHNDEAECMIVSLIDQGYILGYVDHRTATVVLSKNRTFPRPLHAKRK